MDSAPKLVLLKVFSFISVEEKFGTLRLVCKKWRQVVEFQASNDLVVYENDHPLKKRWPSNDAQIDLLNAVSKPFFGFYLINGRHEAIKRLLFYRIDWDGFEHKGLSTKLLDCMCQLEELSVDQTRNAFISNDLWENGANLDRLTLRNLRVLSVKQQFRAKVSITAPRLEKLIIWDLLFTLNQEKGRGLMIDLSHPERLRSLQCQQADLKTRIFANLEQLTALNVALDFDLSHFPKLRQLDLCLCFCVHLGNWSDFHQTTVNLMEQRRELKLNDLRISNFGAKDDVANHNYIRENSVSKFIRFLVDQDIDRFVKNFTVDYLPWSLEFDNWACKYEGLGELGRCRLNIECVTVSTPIGNRPPDPNPLIRFLVEIVGVKCLKIGECSFDQEFFDKLTTVPYIGSLCMPKAFLIPDFDFEFIRRIRWLNHIELHVNRFAIDSFWRTFKRTKIRRLTVVISGEKKPYCPVLELKKNRNTLKFDYFTGTPKKEFDSMDAAFSALKKELEE